MKKVLFAIVAVAVLVGSRSSFAATYDATGIWQYGTSNNWSDSWDCLETPRTDFTAINQIGNTFTYVSPIGIHRGTIGGARYSSTIVYPEDYGFTVQLIEFALSSENAGSGTVLWYWTNGWYECSGGSDIVFTKRPTVATYDATGVWNYVQDENIENNCGLPRYTSTGSVAVTQNGDRFRFADDTGVYAGLVSQKTYISFVALPDDPGVTFNSVLFSLDSPSSGSGTVDWYWTDGWEECWGYDSLTLTRADVTNSPPNAPRLLHPEQNAAAVVLQPRLQAGPFNDPDPGARHLRTEWVLSSDSSFSTTVLATVSDENLTFLRVPRFVLEGGTTYYWRVRYYDDHFVASPWSETYRFTTINNLLDKNGNGIPDFQEVTAFTDLDGNGVADIQQSEMKVLRTEVGNGHMAVSTKDATGVVSVGAVESIDPGGISSLARPSRMPLGLFGMAVNVANPIDTAEITVYFSEPAPEGAQWLVYDSVKGWVNYSALNKAEFGEGRKSVRLKLKDWGFGDSDGLPNGRIVDPGGFGLASWIKGKVFDAHTGGNVAEAVVTVQDLELPCSAEGNFLSVILPGTYTVTASAPGYAAKSVGSVTVTEGGVAEVALGLNSGGGENIEVDLKANGSDGGIALATGAALTVSLGLAPGGNAGTNADWWLLASAPDGLYYLNLATFSWDPWIAAGAPALFGAPLFAFADLPLTVFPGLPTDPGTYAFVFAVDTTMNGILDGNISYDFVVVERTVP